MGYVKSDVLPSNTELLQFLLDNHATFVNMPYGATREAIAKTMRRQAARENIQTK